MRSSCKHVYVALFTMFVPLFLSAQWLETTIYVPDSLCGVISPRAFTYNGTNNKIYVGGWNGNSVVVIDGATDTKIARIPVHLKRWQVLT